MKMKLVLFCILISLATMGSDCINEGFIVTVDLPLEGCYDINAGSNLSFGGSQVYVLEDEIESTYRDDIQAARYYDIRVSVVGTYNGSVDGVARINGIDLLDYQGNWSDFATPQSLLGSSTHITPNAAGINELISILNSLPDPGNTTVTLSSSGTLAGQNPVPSGLSVCIEVLAQVDSQVE
ncbi:MAG: hypothetical protein ACKVRP_00640 [Bacteroidota bacterium]